MKSCDIIIPVWNELESTRLCVNRLKEYTRYPYRLIVIDNGSSEPTERYLKNLKESFQDFLLVRNNKNLGFVKAVNQGVIASESPYVCLLNNDAYVTNNWLTHMVEILEAGPNNIGLVNPTSNVFGKPGPDGERKEWQELDSCRGFCVLIKREVVKKIGLFDEIFGVGYFEEKDFAWRAREAGYLSVRSKASFVEHKDRLSFDKLEERDEIFKRNEQIFNKRWRSSKNIAFVTKEENDLRAKQDIIYEFLKKGHRVFIFFDKRNSNPGLKDHINLKYFPIAKTFFDYIVLFKLWERRRKKKIERIITEDESAQRFFSRFKFIHKAEVVKC